MGLKNMNIYHRRDLDLSSHRVISIYLHSGLETVKIRLFLISCGNKPTDAAQCARQNALKTSSVALKLLELEQPDDVGVQGRGVGKGTGGYRRRLQTAVTNGGYKRQLRRFGNRNETETKPKRTRGIWVGCSVLGPMCCAMVGGIRFYLWPEKKRGKQPVCSVGFWRGSQPADPDLGFAYGPRPRFAGSQIAAHQNTTHVRAGKTHNPGSCVPRPARAGFKAQQDVRGGYVTASA